MALLGHAILLPSRVSGSESSAVPHPVLGHPIFVAPRWCAKARFRGGGETKQVPRNRAIPKCSRGNPRYHFPIVIRLYGDRKAWTKGCREGGGWAGRAWVGRLSEQTPFRQRSTPSARTVTSATARDSILANFQRPAGASCLWHSDSQLRRINSNKLGRRIFYQLAEYVLELTDDGRGWFLPFFPRFRVGNCG